MIFNTIFSIFEWVGIGCLVSIIPLSILSYGFPPVRHFIVTWMGTQTPGTVLISQRCDDREDVCVCGVYKYYDRLNWEHKVKFRYCQHWPSNEEWDQVMQSCGPGAQNTVYYLTWLPFMREIQWNFGNPDVSKRVTATPEQ